VPLASWLASGGRCRYCATPLGRRYPLTELAALVIAAWAAIVLDGWMVLVGCALGWTLLALALIDWREQILPDSLTLPLLAGGLGAAWTLVRLDFIDHAIGAVAGLTLFWAVAAIFRRVRGYDGLGGGDAKLFAASGAWLGWMGLPSVLVIASGAALVGVGVLKLAGKSNLSRTEIAFGPYLCIGFWLVWLYGPLTIGATIWT